MNRFAQIVIFTAITVVTAPTCGRSHGIELPSRYDRASTQQAAVGRLPSRQVMDAVVDWLARNFDLPAIFDHPRVELATAVRMMAIRHPGLASHLKSPDDAAQEDTVAIYDDAQATIYLPQGWTGSTPAEMSILVHEMVHHLQNRGNLRYECLAAREKPAYLAQDKWLKESGTELQSELEVDMFTIIVRSACMN